MKSMQLFDEIANNNTSGSIELVRLLQTAVRQYLNSAETESAELKNVLRRIAAKRSEFPVILHFIYYFLKMMQETFSAEDLLHFIDNYSQQWNIDGLVSGFYADQSLDGKTILLHSNSSTVIGLLDRYEGDKTQVHMVQTFSSPAGEGLKQAAHLAGKGFRVTLIHENNAWNFSGQVDMFLFGADRLEEERFMNKTGTVLLCLMAREKEKPAFVLADPRKYIDNSVYRFLSVAPVEEPPPINPDELVKVSEYPGIEITNQYFEWIPRSLVTQVYS